MDACSIRAAAEQRRVAQHFGRVIRWLERTTPSGLTPSQTRHRRQVIDQLGWYRARGRFPKNRASTRALIPTFIDLDGTRCAVAHLLDRSGEAELSLTIAQEDNHARVPALNALGVFADWVERSGLTPREAALIQPSYCDTSAWECICGSTAGPPQLRIGHNLPVVEVTVVEGGEGRIDAIFGAETNRQVGDIVALADEYGIPVGERLVGWLEDTLVHVQLRRLDDERLDTTVCYLDPALSITPDAPAEISVDTYLAAATAHGDECIARLAQDDLAWLSARECNFAVVEDDDSGCMASASAPGSEALVLLALYAVARRTARRFEG